jgi:hypothetical protein
LINIVSTDFSYPTKYVWIFPWPNIDRRVNKELSEWNPSVPVAQIGAGAQLYQSHPDAHRYNLEFEKMNEDIVHFHCNICKQVSTMLQISNRALDMCNNTGICQRCSTKLRHDPNYSPPWLPTWKDSNGILQHHVPPELTGMRQGEKLMIQILSTYVPMVYMKGGAHGFKGHVCSFPKDMEDFVTELPRKKVEAIRVIRTYLNSEKEVEERTFSIRRSVVLNALRWLKRYNKHYKDIAIREDNLDWMDGKEEAQLDVTVVEDINARCEENTNIRERENSTIPAFGIIRNDNLADTPKPKDTDDENCIQLLKRFANPDNENT